MQRAEIIKRQLNTEEDVKSWLIDMQNNGLNYHYDDDPKDVRELGENFDKPFFNEEESKSLKSKMNDCEKILGSWRKFWDIVPSTPYEQ